MKLNSWPALALAILAFFLTGLFTNWLHDLIFLSHTSIQDNIEVCSNGDCTTEDGVRAYVSNGWALVGNSVSLLLLGARGAVGLFVYVALDEREDISLVALLVIPALMAALAIMNLPFWFYEALRMVVFICCGFLSIEGWIKGMRIVPIPLGLLAVIFNPMVELQLSRSAWHAIDAMAAALLLGLAAYIVYSLRNSVANSIL